jgi:phenylacetate-CoA ligase
MLYGTRSKIPAYIKEIECVDKLPLKQKKKHQKEKLRKILLHAYENVPYYHKVLGKAKVVVNGEINLDNFDKIPLLTKTIIRKEGKNLYAKDYKKRKPYENTSGGSTGEPVRFIQDKEYNEWNIATKLYLFKKLGKNEGEPEIKFWGSDRDIILGGLSLKDRFINFFYNRKFFNSYNFNENKYDDLIELNNKFKPVA